MLMLTNNGIEVNGKNVLLLGAGGAGRSVAKKLSDAGASVSVYDKFAENAQKLAKDIGGVVAIEKVEALPYYLIINATGIGMHKTEGLSPVGEDLISKCQVAIDLIYVPEVSEFLRIANSFGKNTVNGKAMLFYQAYYAECIYFGVAPDSKQAKNLFEKYLQQS
jgi:shikimate dehydrogenase